MVKKLSRLGNSVALVLDKTLLEATGLTADSPVEISTDGQVIVLSPVREKKHKAKLRASMEKVNRRYAEVFKKLADS